MLNDAHCHFFSSGLFRTLGKDAGVTGDAAVELPAETVAPEPELELAWEPATRPERLPRGLRPAMGSPPFPSSCPCLAASPRSTSDPVR